MARGNSDPANARVSSGVSGLLISFLHLKSKPEKSIKGFAFGSLHKSISRISAFFAFLPPADTRLPNFCTSFFKDDM